jgi:hypothetical protein
MASRKNAPPGRLPVDGREKRRGLRCVPHRQFAADGARDRNAFGRIARDDLPRYGLLQRAVKHFVDRPYPFAVMPFACAPR